jgi:4-hydroxythreonine-4-phosphate dehydrogenase
MKIGITIGDINGVGPEVIIKALANEDRIKLFDLVIYGPLEALEHHKALLPEIENFRFYKVADAAHAKPNHINVVNTEEQPITLNLGAPTAESGRYAFNALERAMNDLQENRIDALVTAPISKHAMKMSGFNFPGHTEYLASKAPKSKEFMLMVAEDLRVALLTGHIPLQEVSSKLNKDTVVQMLQRFNQTLRKDFGIDKPKIAVLGLNPHAGESGNMGTEEVNILIPAIKQVQKAHNILAVGPYPADGFFGTAEYSKFDGVLAMYHDQGLIPFKTLCFENGVNFTAGLPFVRTSPDHGTAYDIAGQNKADESSMIHAIYLAKDLLNSRAAYEDRYASPLQPQYDEEIEREKRVPDGYITEN